MLVAFLLSRLGDPSRVVEPQLASATWPRLAGAVAVFCWFALPVLALGCCVSGPRAGRIAAALILVAWALLFALTLVRPGLALPGA